MRIEKIDNFVESMRGIITKEEMEILHFMQVETFNSILEHETIIIDCYDENHDEILKTVYKKEITLMLSHLKAHKLPYQSDTVPQKIRLVKDLRNLFIQRFNCKPSLKWSKNTIEDTFSF